jgi:amino acid adenylation domain-containing protein
MDIKELLKNYHTFSKEKKKLFEAMLKEKGIEITDYVILPQKREGNPIPASFAQRRLWFLEQFEPGSPLYIIPIAVKVKGKLNESLLEKTINTIVERHEVLRTSFKSIDGEVFQVIYNEAQIKIKQIDLSNEPNNENKLNEIILRENTEPFDLTQVPLIRVSLVKLNENEQVLLIPMHHIISDNWSTAVFVKELLEIYKALDKGEKINLDPLPIQYADFSVWQKDRFNKNIYEEQTDYWVSKLADSNEVLDIITDYKRPPVQTFNGSFELFEIPKDILVKLNQLAKRTDTTLFMILISAFQVMLYRYTNQDDINIGTPIANRNRAEIEGLIGFFINTLVLRADLSGNPTFNELLQRTKKISLEAYQNQDVPFEDIVDKLKLERNLSHTALFQTMFVLNNARMEKLELTGAEFEVLDTDTSTTKFDLVLSITENDNILKGKLEYNTDLFKSFTIKKLIESFIKILSEVANNPDLKLDEIELNEKEELPILVGEFYNTINDIDICSLIENTAKKYPNKTALSCKKEKTTYAELIIKVNSFAGYLQEKGIKQKDIVAVYLDRTIDYVISMLAIMKAGATYLPLDIDYPKERLKYLLNDSDAKFIISNNQYSTDLGKFDKEIINVLEYQSNENKTTINAKPQSDNTAYIIYTSGSTGNPKGVEVTHKVLANHVLIMQKHFNVTENDKELEFAAFNFDASIEQILVPLISGAELFIRGNDIWTTSEFTKIINEEKLTIINPPTVVWAELAKYWNENPDKAPNNQLKLCIAGGDEMKPDIIKLWMDSPMKSVRLLNAYGPTEGIITVSTAEINKIETEGLFRTPIGTPLPGRKFYIVDKNMKLLPKGFAGELCIGSELLAKGYLNNPEITKEKFVKNIFVENKMYRTGDLVRINENDNIEFIGRIDTQVKIRGFRIELGEIESILRSNDLVKDAIVNVHTENGDKILVAYLIVKNNQEFNSGDIKNYLKNKLPEYMVPSSFIKLDKFPTTPSGKIDKKALPKPEGVSPELKTEYVMPRTETEENISNIVADVLKINKVGVFDNFFELGGHSMLAMQVISRINDEFHVEISIKSLFENPTIDGISNAIFEAQILNQNEDELDELLKEIGGLSDEDTKTILADSNKQENNFEQNT